MAGVFETVNNYTLHYFPMSLLFTSYFCAANIINAFCFFLIFMIPAVCSVHFPGTHLKKASGNNESTCQILLHAPHFQAMRTSKDSVCWGWAPFGEENIGVLQGETCMCRMGSNNQIGAPMFLIVHERKQCRSSTNRKFTVRCSVASVGI